MDPSNYMSNSNSAQSYLMGSGAIPQFLLALVIGIILYVIMMTLEITYNTWTKAAGSRIDVLPYRVSPDDKMITIVQNPKAPKALTLPLSNNERTGAEFSYSFYMYLNPNNIESNQTTTQGLRHVFHKGYTRFAPLMGPGVFVKTNENALRIYMNSSKKWDNYVDIPNIPLKKWVHIAIVGRKNTVEIYINGNIAKKVKIDGVIYQNYEDLILFSQRVSGANGTLKHTDGSLVEVKGPFSGSFASLVYFSYAISYSEVQGLIQQGPSTESESSSSNTPSSPYLTDSWWVSH